MPKIVTKVEYEIVRLLMVINIWWLGIKLYKNPLTAFKVVKQLIADFQEMIGNKKLVRAFKIDGKYAWDMFNPAWPSPGFNTFFRSHLQEIKPTSPDQLGLRRLLIAITKRCPLSCEHCSEGATLYNRDVLSCDEFIHRIDKYVQQGVGQLIYSGGEPLSRFEDLLTFLDRFNTKCDQWIYTSGFGLTLEKARELKKAGLNGAAISLDNHIEQNHNTFRGSSKSFYWVHEAVKNLQEIGVLVALNVCPTKSYIESGGVEELIELAKKWNVPIVNLLEPRAVGNYQDKEVELEIHHKERLKKLSNQFNFSQDFLVYPTVLYPAGYRSAKPCGGGISYLFLDYDGTLYPCPFCKVKMPKVPKKTALCEA
ncbi:radical SAM protein [Algoriphagus sp.]|uniref:radical SAM/SPASM domain-containing protein n=1 Tax=Algoriphagus sp. TaxID=1872435 RepID=UPI0025DAC581|nr:radical SAM protein [Algoriphagus sp.]